MEAQAVEWITVGDIHLLMWRFHEMAENNRFAKAGSVILTRKESRTKSVQTIYEYSTVIILNEKPAQPRV